jgi:hypothetical protein
MANSRVSRVDVKRITASAFRNRLKQCLRAATNNRVVLIENRRQPSKYLVDKEFLDALVRDQESMFATLEILCDQDLTNRLLHLSKTIDDDFAEGNLLTSADVFGK